MRETSSLSVSRVMDNLKAGDQDAATQLWAFLQKRLLEFSKHATHSPHATYDEQDVAQSAFAALCNGFESKRYDQVTNRDELWKLLAVITVNKARKKASHENRLCRGGGFKQHPDNGKVLEFLPSRQLDPELELLFQEECSRLLKILGKQELQMVAILKVEGYTNEEIANQIGCTRRAVQRRLALIREFWSEELS